MVETRWTQVVLSRGATPEAQLALRDLTAAYYLPVYRFIQERAENGEAAKDLTQAFFERVLERYGFEGADPERGRFRSFLLGAVKHFLAEAYARQGRDKRGGHAFHQSLDAGDKGDSMAPAARIPDPGAVPPDEAFDRHWAHTVLDRALIRLEKACDAEGRHQQFEVLQPWLAGGTDQTQAEAGSLLGLGESATRVAIHRLRRRFRECVRAELAQTLAPGISVDDEMRYLLDALKGGMNP